MTTREKPPNCCSVPLPPLALSSSERARVLEISRALGDATRLEVLLLIAGQTEPICACDVVGRFDLSQPTISHHLRVLRESGLIRASRRGVWAYYEADPSALPLLAAFRGERQMALAS